MFVKRINKIQYQSNLIQQPTIQSLKVFRICADPHGRLIAMYSEQKDMIHIISIYQLLNFISLYRQNYAQTKKYSFPSALRSQLSFVNPRTSLNIFLLKFTLSIQDTQFLMVSYYPATIDLYSVINGNRIHSLSIDNNAIVGVNIIGHSLYISLYTNEMMCFEGNELKRCRYSAEHIADEGVMRCYKDEVMRLTYSEGSRPNSKKKGVHASEENANIGRNKKEPVYMNSKGDLMIGETPIVSNKASKISEKLHAKTDTNHCQTSSEQPQTTVNVNHSFLEYLRHESQKCSAEGHCLYNLYELSLCYRFIICNEGDYRYTLRMKNDGKSELFGKKMKLRWQIIAHFSSKPVVNHFYTASQQSPNYLFVAYVGLYNDVQTTTNTSKSMQHDAQHSLTIVGLDLTIKDRYQLICELTDCKRQITKIYWIGPHSLLYTDQKQSVYYVQLNISKLIPQQ